MTQTDPEIRNLRTDNRWLFVLALLGTAASLAFGLRAVTTASAETGLVNYGYAYFAASLTVVVMMRLTGRLVVAHDDLAHRLADKLPQAAPTTTLERPTVRVKGRAGETNLNPDTVSVQWSGPPPVATVAIHIDSLADDEFWLELVVPGATKFGS